MPDATPAPARDKLTYWPANGSPIEFVPADGAVLVADRDVERISVHRPGGRVGEWVRATAVGTPPPPAPAPPSVPPPPSPPQAPELRRMVVAESAPRDQAARVDARSAGDVLVVRDLYVDGYEDGVSIEHTGGRPVLVENVRVLNTWRMSPDRQFKGQGLYADDCGPLTVRGSYFARCGWQPGRPPHERNMYRHGGYVNFGVAGVAYEDCWIDEACAAGIQTRGPVAAIRRCLISYAAVGILALGPATIENVTVYGGHHRYNPPEPADPAAGKPARPASWTGNTGLSVYHPTTARDLWIVGRPGQGDAQDLIPGLKANNIGAVVGSGSYGKPEWRPPVDADGKVVRDLLAASDCRIVGWPSPAFAGDRPHGGSGFAVGGSAVDVDLGPLRAAVLAARTAVEVAAIVAAGQRLVRAAAAATFAA